MQNYNPEYKSIMDEDVQEDIIAYEMQALFDDYKNGDVSAYDKIVKMYSRYEALLGDTGKKLAKDLLRKKLD